MGLKKDITEETHWLAIIIIVPILALVFGIQEILGDYISWEAVTHLIFAGLGGGILYWIMNTLVPIEKLKKNMHRLPELNFEYVNNYDTDMDNMNDVLEKINQQIKSNNSLNDSNDYVNRAILDIDRVVARLSLDPNTVKQLENAKKVLNKLTTNKVKNKTKVFNLRSSSNVQTIELNADSVWVMSNNLTADTVDDHLKDNVVKKLKGDYTADRGKASKGRYCYIVPDTVIVNNNIKLLKDYWVSRGVDDITISHVRFIKLDPKQWLQAHDVTIYNGNSVKKIEDKEKKIIEFLSIKGEDGSNNYVYRELSFENESNFVEVISSVVRKDLEDGKNSGAYITSNEAGIWNASSEFLKSGIEKTLQSNDKNIWQIRPNAGENIQVVDLECKEVTLSKNARQDLIKKCLLASQSDSSEETSLMFNDEVEKSLDDIVKKIKKLKNNEKKLKDELAQKNAKVEELTEWYYKATKNKIKITWKH